MAEKADKTDQKVDEIAEATAHRVKEARAAVSEKVTAAKEKIGEASQVAGKKLQEVKGQASEKGQAAREKTVEGLKHGYERVRKDFDDLNSDVNAYVRDNPGRSILIAAGAGFLLGMLLRRDR